MGLDTSTKKQIINDHKLNDSDTGSTEVQIAILTKRILGLTDHLIQHNHDEITRRGLLRLVSQRRKLLRYLKSENTQRYLSIIATLNLRK
ncbi:MAG: 30S ribosomal protein S15 [SAR202 cluster bacterium]|nr:30S ribosomal protein S15 [SAR202 cluster bacterium]